MKKSGFTLIELLVVIVIIGVLFTVALPMFENAGKKDTDRAARQLLNVLRMARQHAISKRQWTLVVFPNQDSFYDPKGEVTVIHNLRDKCLRSYAVLAVTNSMDGLYNWGNSGWGKGSWRDPPADAMKFEFLMNWRQLPDGVYFDDERSEKGSADYLFGNSGGYEGTFHFPWDPEHPDKRDGPMSAVLFKPNGRVFCMFDGNTSKGTFWQEKQAKIYITSSKIYSNPTGSSLGDSHEMPGGTNTVIQLQEKTGQVKIIY